MRRHYALISALTVTATITFGAAAAAPPQMQIAVTKTSVTVSNVARGGSVILFACSRDVATRAIAVRPRAIALKDDDRDGSIQFAPKEGIAMRSVWIAVDETTGDYVAGAQSEFPLALLSFGAGDLKKDVEGEVAELSVDLPRLVTLIVRPGVGAWAEAAFDGDKNDHDAASNGRLKLNFDDWRTIDGKEKAPKHLKHGDVLVAIDPGQLDVYATQVGK